MSDWTGNSKAIFTTLGASSHALEERQEEDYYATDPKAMRLLLEVETFSNVWECSCGEGHLAKEMEHILGKASDIIYRGYGEQTDFLKYSEQWNGDIITNPPYSYAKEFVEHAINLIPEGRKVAMFLKVQFLEGKSRKTMFQKYPPKTIYISSSRISCAKNGNFNKYESSAVAYAWFVWEKGFKGDPIIKWIN